MARQQRPDNPRLLVSPPLPLSGFCHGARPGAESTDFVGPFYAPPSESLSAPHARGACADSSPAFADAEQAFLPPGGMLAWHQPQPGGKRPAVLERAHIADRCHQCRCREGANAWNRHQALPLRMRRGQGFACLLVIGQLLLQNGKLVDELCRNLSWLKGVSLALSASSLLTTVWRNCATPLGTTMPYSCSSPCLSFTRAVRAPLGARAPDEALECLAGRLPSSAQNAWWAVSPLPQCLQRPHARAAPVGLVQYWGYHRHVMQAVPRNRRGKAQSSRNGAMQGRRPARVRQRQGHACLGKSDTDTGML